MSSPSDKNLLLRLPLEIRESVYDYVLQPEIRERRDEPYYTFDVAIFRVCLQISKESQYVFNRKYFIILFQSNSSVVGDLATKNQVPIVHSGRKAELCKNYILRVTITYTQIGASTRDRYNTIILLEDLPKFCKTWFYWYGKASLWEKLLILEINDNGSAMFHNGSLSIQFQEKLLFPFGVLGEKDLVEIKGNWHDQSVEDALRQMIKIPEASPLERLEESNRLKNSGNEALAAGDLEKALNLYIQALDELFVVCSGRRRMDTRKAYFDVELIGSQFPVRSGMGVYYLLRAKLAANITQVYLKMESYEETYFWGNRAIDTMHKYQESYEDRLGIGSPANDAIGRIFYRTGVAAKALGDESEARRLFKVAADYLPNDLQIKRDLASVALRIG